MARHTGVLAVSAVWGLALTTSVLAQSASVFVDEVVREKLSAGDRTTRVLILSRDPSPQPGEAAPTQRRQGLTMDALSKVLRSEAPILKPTGEAGVAAAALTVKGLDAIARTKGVVAVVEDLKLKKAMFDTHPLVQVDSFQRRGMSGKDQIVAVIDDGFEVTHPFIASAIAGEACFSTNDKEAGYASLCPGGQEAVSGAGVAANCTKDLDCDHGTHVAGIVAGRGGKTPQGQSFDGVAPAAKLYVIKAVSREPDKNCAPAKPPCATFLTSNVIQALKHIEDQAAKMNIVAVNLSIGSDRLFPFNCDRMPNSPLSAAYAEIINRLSAKGIAVIAAAGNSSRIAGVGMPACVSGAMAVGSIERDGQVSRFSDTGIKVDLLAPGGDILSSVPGGQYAAKSGTSMAAPYVAGIIALMRENASPAVVPTANLMDALRRTGRMVRDPRNDLFFPVAQVEKAFLALIDTKMAADKAFPPAPAPAPAAGQQPAATPAAAPAAAVPQPEPGLAGAPQPQRPASVPAPSGGSINDLLRQGAPKANPFQ